MGVIRNRVSISQADETAAIPEEHSSHSESESENEEDPPRLLKRQRHRNRSLNYTDELKIPNSHAGRRKIRRHVNEKTLQVYLQDDKEDQNRLLEPYKDPFARLMDATREPIELLNNFSQKLEEESMVDPVNAKEKSKLTPFQRISNKIRRAMKLKRKFPLCLAETIEGDVVNFFKLNPMDIFCCVPTKSFERLLFHAVSQYHGLSSMSLAKNGHICVEVLNNSKNWCPVEIMLCKYIVDANVLS